MVDRTFQGIVTSCPFSPALQTSAVAQDRFNYAEICCDSGILIYFSCISAVAQDIDITGLNLRIQ